VKLWTAIPIAKQSAYKAFDTAIPKRLTPRADGKVLRVEVEKLVAESKARKNSNDPYKID
jgi:hypothetical protein